MTESVDAKLLGELAVVVIRAVSVPVIQVEMELVGLVCTAFIVIATSVRS
jgi:hypothetical protein